MTDIICPECQRIARYDDYKRQYICRQCGYTEYADPNTEYYIQIAEIFDIKPSEAKKFASIVKKLH